MGRVSDHTEERRDLDRNPARWPSHGFARLTRGSGWDTKIQDPDILEIWPSGRPGDRRMRGTWPSDRCSPVRKIRSWTADLTLHNSHGSSLRRKRLTASHRCTSSSPLNNREISAQHFIYRHLSGHQSARPLHNTISNTPYYVHPTASPPIAVHMPQLEHGAIQRKRKVAFGDDKYMIRKDRQHPSKHSGVHDKSRASQQLTSEEQRRLSRRCMIDTQQPTWRRASLIFGGC